jgi:hypothetical protein
MTNSQKLAQRLSSIFTRGRDDASVSAEQIKDASEVIEIFRQQEVNFSCAQWKIKFERIKERVSHLLD